MNLKRKFQKLVWPIGSIATIRRGPLRGYRFVISENSGWSPILGRWEPEMQEVFCRVVRYGMTVLDLGANNGIHSLLLAKLAGDAGRVLAFEPLPNNMDELRENCRLNRVQTIEVVPLAAGDEDREVTFHLGLHSKQGSVVGIGYESGTDISVCMARLDTYCNKHGIRPDFIKIDIEGAESAAIRGLGRLLAEVRPRIVVELHNAEQVKNVCALFKTADYGAYLIDPRTRSSETPVSCLKRIANLAEPFREIDDSGGTIFAFHNSTSTVLFR